MLDICNQLYDEINKKIFMIENKLLKKWVKYDMTSDSDTESDSDSPNSNQSSDLYMNYISKEIHKNIIDMNRSYMNKQDEKINIIAAQYEELAEQNRNMKAQIKLLNEKIQNSQINNRGYSFWKLS